MRWLVLLLAAALLAPAGLARANGDPASDVLLSQDDFLPYAPAVQPRLKTALEDVLEEARSAGYPMKVALINSRSDLGAYPELFNQPQRYADLLTTELATLNPHGTPQKDVHLLVVMPGGFGGSNLGEGVDRALGAVDVESDAASDGLAKAAIAGVARLATENGHRVAVPPEASLALDASSASSDGSKTSPLLFVLPAVLLFAALFVAGRIAARRQRSATAASE